MFRLVRTATLRALYADRTELAATKEDLAITQAAAGSANDAAERAAAVAEKQLRQLAEVHAALMEVERERDRARVDARKEAGQQLAELGEDLARLRDAAADTETGQTVRAAIAYRVLRDLYADGRRRGLKPGRPFDVAAAVLGFDTDPSSRNVDADT